MSQFIIIQPIDEIRQKVLCRNNGTIVSVPYTIAGGMPPNVWKINGRRDAESMLKIVKNTSSLDAEVVKV